MKAVLLTLALVIAGGAPAWAKGPPQWVLDKKACQAQWVADRKANPGKPAISHNDFISACLKQIKSGR